MQPGTKDISVLHRRIIGAAIGGILCATIAWGYFGGWERLYLLSLPITSSEISYSRWSKQMLWLGPIIAGVGGVIIGGFIASAKGNLWKRMLKDMLGFSLIVVLIWGMDDFMYVLCLAFPTTWLLLFMIVLPIAGTFEGVLYLFSRVWQRDAKLWRVLGIVVGCLFSIIMGLIIIWPMFITAPNPSLDPLRQVDKYLQSKGYTGYTLEITSWEPNQYKPGARTYICVHFADNLSRTFKCSSSGCEFPEQ